MPEAGAAGFTDADRPIADSQVMRRVLLVRARPSTPSSSSTPEDAALAGGGGHRGRVRDAAGPAGDPADRRGDHGRARSRLVEMTGARLHGRQVSTAPRLASAIAAPRRAGWRSPATPPRTYFCASTRSRSATTAPSASSSPPLRAEADRQAVVDATGDGTIDVIASAHAPHGRGQAPALRRGRARRGRPRDPAARCRSSLHHDRRVKLVDGSCGGRAMPPRASSACPADASRPAPRPTSWCSTPTTPGRLDRRRAVSKTRTRRSTSAPLQGRGHGDHRRGRHHHRDEFASHRRRAS